MKHVRAIFIGAMVWVFIFTSFAILGFVPSIKDSITLQAIIICILIVPFALFGASIFYKNGNKENGMTIGIIMTLTALILDAMITVPFIEIPKGGSYQSFYSFPPLWLLVIINIVTVYFFWKLKINRSLTYPK
jgi:hypothetical protein